MTVKAIDAANYLVYLMSDICDDLTNMKINKLLYYAQGYYMRKHGIPMFDECFEAWEHGPVVPSVYTKYKTYGDNPITVWDDLRLNEVNDAASDTLMDVAREYGKYTASALRNMTHALGGPWDQVYSANLKHIEIPAALIKRYFTSDKIKEIKPVEIDFSEDDFIGYRDKHDTLVLPSAWNDETL